jgi:hypothetical protein
VARFGRTTRENIRFLAGLAGLAFEMIVEHSDRPVLLGIFAGMIGMDVIITEMMPGGRRKTDPPE